MKDGSVMIFVLLTGPPRDEAVDLFNVILGIRRAAAIL